MEACARSGVLDNSAETLLEGILQCGYPVVSGSVVPWGERYEQKGQAEKRAAN